MMTCRVCKQVVDPKNEAAWSHNDKAIAHLWCADALIAALFQLQSRHEYGATVFNIIADRAKEIVESQVGP